MTGVDEFTCVLLQALLFLVGLRLFINCSVIYLTLFS